MRYKILLTFGIFFFGCARSEKLDEDEMHYVRMTLSLTKARIESRDSLQLIEKLDSVYKKLGISKDSYKKQTTDFSNDPERAAIIFRAIADSMNLK